MRVLIDVNVVLDVIRDPKGFADSPVPVLSPTDLRPGSKTAVSG